MAKHDLGRVVVEFVWRIFVPQTSFADEMSLRWLAPVAFCAVALLALLIVRHDPKPRASDADPAAIRSFVRFASWFTGLGLVWSLVYLRFGKVI